MTSRTTPMSIRCSARLAISTRWSAGPRARPAGHHRPGALPHLRPAPWFIESRLEPRQPQGRLVCLGRPKPDGTPPNNWLSIFGGSAWEWDGRREQYYLHNFLTSQPDLNFHNPEVQDALLDVARFWLDRGVDGFRLDTINFYSTTRSCATTRRSPGAAQRHIAPEVNPYNWQDHLYDKNQPENLEFLRRLPRAAGRIPRTHRRGRGRRRAVRAADPGRLHLRQRQGAHVLFLRVPVGHHGDPGSRGRGRDGFRGGIGTAGPAGRFPTMT
jgi:hypothetical protein